MAELGAAFSVAGPFVLAVLALMAAGLVPPRIADVRGATAFEAGVRLIGAVVVLFGLLLVVPKFKRVFTDFGAELSIITEWVITLSDAARFYGLEFITVALGLSIAEVFTFAALHRNESTRPIATVASYAATGLCTVLGVGIITGCLPPVVRLLNELS